MAQTDLTVRAVPSLKMLREALCLAQTALTQLTEITITANRFDTETAQLLLAHARLRSKNLQTVIDAIDVQRPLGPDGKHGDNHTTHCGCDKVGRTRAGLDGYRGPSVPIPKPGRVCGYRWVAEIGPCVRCGLGAAEHDPAWPSIPPGDDDRVNR